MSNTIVFKAITETLQTFTIFDS